MRGNSFLLVFLLIASCLSSLTLSADPTCSKGISFRGACCPSACKQCGGPGCHSKSVQFKTRCCADGILRSNLASCNARDPPCRITGNANPTSVGNPTSSLNGKWSYAAVKSGSLVKRHEACAVMVNGLVVLVGGRGKNKPTSIYNPKTQQWKRGKGPGPGIEIHHFQCVAIGNRVWIISSWTGGYPFEKNNDKIYIYDVGQDRWITRKSTLSADRLRGGGATVVRGDWIYLIAGNRGGHGEHSTSLKWMDAYNWKKNEWTAPGSFEDLPGGGRDHVGGALVKGQLCVAGGRNGGTSKFFNNVRLGTYCYNFSTKKWIAKALFPAGRAGAMTGTTCDGRMMIAGGEGFGQAYKRVDVFDGSKWQRAPDLVGARHGSGLAISKCTRCSHIFIPSGSGRQGGSPELLTTEEWVPNGSPSKCVNY